MREIKFRGKRESNGEWIYGDLLQENSGRKVIMTNLSTWGDNPDDVEPYGDDITVDPNTVGQYTGLKDKNGKEIYEGDIMCLSDRGSHKEEVIVEHGLYGWTFYNPKTATFYSDGSHTYCAIENYRFMFGTGVCIGNIHDNPELLNTK